jgi:hypothetical protein
MDENLKNLINNHNDNLFNRYNELQKENEKLKTENSEMKKFIINNINEMENKLNMSKTKTNNKFVDIPIGNMNNIKQIIVPTFTWTPPKLPEKIPEKISEKIPEKIPEKILEKLPEKIPEKLSSFTFKPDNIKLKKYYNNIKRKRINKLEDFDNNIKKGLLMNDILNYNKLYISDNKQNKK